MKRTFADRVLEFNTSLPHPRIRVAGVKTLDPYRDALVRVLAAKFYHAYYSDNNPRVFVFGINPGRFGAGTTGIPFTDPVALKDACGIDNDLARKRELSSVFIYSFIDHWGGPTVFYRRFFFGAVSPVGFVKDGLNYNYYDHPRLLKQLQPFIVSSMRAQVDIGAERDAAIVLGTGKTAASSRISTASTDFSSGCSAWSTRASSCSTAASGCRNSSSGIASHSPARWLPAGSITARAGKYPRSSWRTAAPP